MAKDLTRTFPTGPIKFAPDTSSATPVVMSHQHYRQVPKSRGFTLIEILVVIAVVAVLTTVVTLNLSFRNVSKSIRNEALRIGLLMQVASDTAVYSRQQLGIRFHPESYEFYILVEPEEGGDPAWQVVEDDRLAMNPPQEDIVLQVDIEDIPIVLETLEEERSAKVSDEEEAIKPHVLFLSNGEIMPEYRVIVEDKEDGEFRFQVFSGEEEPIVVEVVE